MLETLVLSLLLGLFTAITLNAAFVVYYNRYLAMMHESSVKKVMALAGLPLGTLLGIAVACFVYSEAISGFLEIIVYSLAIAGVLICLMVAAADWHQYRNRWAVGTVERHDYQSIANQSAVNTRQFPAHYKFILQLLAPFNQVDQLLMHRVELTERELPGLDAAWNGKKILHITDWHLHSTLHPTWTEFLLEAIQAEQPDVILFGGDFLSKYAHVEHIAAYLHQFKAPLGVYYVRGNHDFWKSPNRIKCLAKDAGWLLISNQAITILADGKPLTIMGFETPYVPLTTAEELALTATTGPRIALVHTPEAYPAAAACGAHLALAGHTHGGQMRLPFFGTTICGCSVPRAFADGQSRLGKMLTWTSRGAGSFFPLRINCRPELLIFTLRS